MGMCILAYASDSVNRYANKGVSFTKKSYWGVHRINSEARSDEKNRRAREGRSPLEPPIVPSGAYGRRRCFHVWHTIAILFQVAPGFPFKRLPYRIFRAVRIKELLQVAIQRAHFVHRIHGVVGRADLPEARSAHELEKAQTGLAICRAPKSVSSFGRIACPAFRMAR